MAEELPTYQELVERVDKQQKEIEELRAEKAKPSDVLAALRKTPHDPVETLLPESVKGDLIANGTVTDAKLASPNSALYKVLFSTHGLIGVDTAAATFLLGSRRDNNSMMMQTGVDEPISGFGVEPPDFFHFVAADFNIPNTGAEELALRVMVAANATAPGINFTFSLRAPTVAGAADNINYAAGAAISGTSIAINTPSASTISTAVLEDIALPANNEYIAAVATSGTIANNSMVSCHAQLMIRSPN